MVFSLRGESWSLVHTTSSLGYNDVSQGTGSKRLMKMTTFCLLQTITPPTDTIPKLVKLYKDDSNIFSFLSRKKEQSWLTDIHLVHSTSMYNMGSNSLVHNLTPIKYNVTRLTINATLKCWINTILGWKPVLIIGHAVNFMHVKETNKSQIFIYFSSRDVIHFPVIHLKTLHFWGWFRTLGMLTAIHQSSLPSRLTHHLSSSMS